MQVALRNDPKVISIDRMRFRAAKCEKCGAKMFPTSLLKPHLTRHRRREQRLNLELSKLRQIMNHMREFAEPR
jgi:methionyl-tRNA synthetase